MRLKVSVGGLPALSYNRRLAILGLFCALRVREHKLIRKNSKFSRVRCLIVSAELEVTAA